MYRLRVLAVGVMRRVERRSVVRKRNAQPMSKRLERLKFPCEKRNAQPMKARSSGSSQHTDLVRLILIAICEQAQMRTVAPSGRLFFNLPGNHARTHVREYAKNVL